MATSTRSATSVPAEAPKVSSEDIISQKTDLCLSNAIVKAGIGFGSGVLLSVILLRRRAFPVWLGTGFGLGSAWTDCERSFNPVAIPGVRILPSPHSASAPSPGQPSVMERLSEKTADLVDKSKDVAREAASKGKEKAREVEDKTVVLRSPDEEQRAQHMPSSQPPEDCLGCRLVGFATLLTLSGFCFSEAFRLAPSKQAPTSSTPSLGKSKPIPNAKGSTPFFGRTMPPKGSLRFRIVSLCVVGAASGVSAVYRLVI